MAPVAPRIVNEVSCVPKIKHASLSAWQVQYVMSLDPDACCSRHCK